MIALATGFVASILYVLLAAGAAIWLIARGYPGPGSALLLWAFVSGCGGFVSIASGPAISWAGAMYGTTDLTFQAIQIGLGVWGALTSLTSTALLAWAALGDRVTPTAPRS